MPPSLGDRLEHILEAIENVRTIILDRTASDLVADTTLHLALERAFEIICEASRHVPAEVKAKEAQIDWQKMTDFGNLLRHAYHRIDINRLLEIANEDLPPLKAFVERILREENNT